MTKLTPTSEPVARVRDALGRVDCDPPGAGQDFTALCPGHTDRNPSLHVSEAADGRVLLHCFAGCTTETIVAALGLTLADLFPRDPLDGPHWPRPLRDRYVELAGRVPALIAEHDARRARDADVLLNVLVQLLRDARSFTGSLAFTCPACEVGHAWIRWNRAGLVADCSDGCDEHQILEALAGVGRVEEAA
jgi:hypothetical protein